MRDSLSPGSDVTIEVDAAHAGTRLDKFLATQLPELSRSRVQLLLEEGRVTRGADIITDPALKTKEKECYRLVIPPTELTSVEAEDIALNIVYEDADLLVINKQAGLTVHPAPGNRSGTLVNALLHHCGDSLSSLGGVARPGILHRLDKDTSGLMVVAKNDVAHRRLAAQLADRSLSRTYLAIVWGVPKPAKGTITGNIGRSTKNRKKMAVVTSGGKEATTHYAVLEVLGDGTASLVECKLETGRTHQIRVHMTHIGHALIGDPAYGSPRKLPAGTTEARSVAIRGFLRQALHAVRLSFLHPSTGERLSFEAAIPKDFQTLKNHLQHLKT
ncbi:MAG: RluA family pseudouridine synthase [Alphaproteobacteria bacterium]|nr:RluA family pseudouridine synthase [Alphaproteobacteria bacterium]